MQTCMVYLKMASSCVKLQPGVADFHFALAIVRANLGNLFYSFLSSSFSLVTSCMIFFVLRQFRKSFGIFKSSS